jgi:hypothetical protein
MSFSSIIFCSKCNRLIEGSFILVNSSSKPSRTLKKVHGTYCSIIEKVDFENKTQIKISYKDMLSGQIRHGWFEKIIECIKCDK